MDYKTLTGKVSEQYAKNLPFVIYSLPNSEIIEGYCQLNADLNTSESLAENGFVLAPFDRRLKTIVIPKNSSEIIKCEFNLSEIEKKYVEIFEDEKDKISYEQLIKETIATIQKGEAKKIVFSRKKDFLLKRFSIETLIERILFSYPNAFRYIWFHPETGIWCGATPETLVEIADNNLKTMALAGTQPFTEGSITWGKKELEEQQFVTEAILHNLKGLVEEVQLSETHSHRAGNLLHLRTLISGKLVNEKGILKKIAQALHPTPAVCGTPRKFARNYIIENEGYPREYYTGFIGPISKNATSASLMVNLRCMKIVDRRASIYVGGGITADSIASEEWIETQNKMQTMLQVLQPML